MASDVANNPRRGEDWSSTEVLATVDAYFEMYDDIMAGREVNKSRVYASLFSRFPARSVGAFESKCRNVSACLDLLGVEWIDGLKPLAHFQRMLGEAVEERVLARSSALGEFAAREAAPSLEPIVENVFVPPPVSDATYGAYRSRVARKIDYAAREAGNRSLGMAGEEWVVRLEQTMLRVAGHDDLASQVAHVSRTRGDGLGFDVESFDHHSREPRLIEVKTTRAGVFAPFFVTRNEVEVSETSAEIYRLYRVHSFGRRARVYVLEGNLSESCRLDAISYRALPKIA